LRKSKTSSLLDRQGRASIKKIRDSTGARNIFSSNDDKDEEVITIIGIKEIIETVRQQHETFIRKVNNNTENEMQHPNIIDILSPDVKTSSIKLARNV
jgi:hypothetical protein